MSDLQNSRDGIENTRLFLEYLKTQGFNSGSYEQILELNQGVESSISKLLQGYNQFLLSTKVDYQKIIANHMRGAYGYVDINGIFVPKTLEADSYFFSENLMRVPWYEYPKLKDGYSEFDAVISKGISEEDKFDLIIDSGMPLFLGDVLDLTKEDYEIVRRKLVCKLYKLKSDNYNITISTDRDSSSNKEYVLLSRTKKY